MKKIISLALLFAVILCAFSCSVLAMAATTDNDYLLISANNTTLYANTARMDPLFVLQKTYYVKVVELNYMPKYHLVSYNGINGLVLITDVGSTPVSNVENPYYTNTIIVAHTNTYLYSSANFANMTSLSASGVTLTYLGKILGDKGTYDTATWYAVLYNNNVYYLHCNTTNNLSLLEATFNPIHPNSVIVPNPTIPDNTDTTPVDKKVPDGSTTVRLLLLAGIIIPALIIIFLLFKPKENKSRRRRHDDRYYTPKRRYYERYEGDDYYDDDYYDE